MPPKRRLSTSESTGGDENDGSGTKRKKLDEPGQMQAVLEFIKKFQKRSGTSVKTTALWTFISTFEMLLKKHRQVPLNYYFKDYCTKIVVTQEASSKYLNISEAYMNFHHKLL